MRASRLRHDDNPVLEWCLSNILTKTNRGGNLCPTKQRPDQKIDAAVGLMMASSRAISEEDAAIGADEMTSRPGPKDQDDRGLNAVLARPMSA